MENLFEDPWDNPQREVEKENERAEDLRETINNESND